ncbi:TonB-dependent receptor [Thalassotalea marina]|uniref:TonB-dependent receptor n=1 Tax=Thalassotalea marina TaxID=1673741 RepID=A0A919EGZ3_9GAMM|nr:TonB-dependent receptor [Thalassotalea marina]GHF81684.1 TonB-dependent receptor [Thalassotalea marina]
MNFKCSQISTALICALSGLSLFSHATDTVDIERIEVTGDFKQQTIQQISSSVQVFDEKNISERNAVHLENLLNSAANVNYTAGASRGRFVQIRGIGLRSQFVDPVNPPVGMVIDGINYSGLGGSSLLFDTQQAEIYRGPQGTRFGADALAGMIHIKTNEAGSDTSNKLLLGVGNYDSWQAGVAFGKDITTDTAFRVSAYQAKSDGSVDNAYLNTETQDQDEQLLRFKLSSQLSNNWQSQLTGHYINIDNGYDGFTLDNSRTSIADQPGEDIQESFAFAWKNTYTGLSNVDIALTLTSLNADSLYSFDVDWVCNDPKQAKLCEAGLHDWGFSYFDEYERERTDNSAELVLSSKDKSWVTGVYYQSKEEDLFRQYTGLDQDFSSNYQIENVAIYGQKEFTLNDKLTLIAGARLENYQIDYIDNNGYVKSTDDTMLGAKLALEYQLNDHTMTYASMTRGYTVGGINGEALAKAKEDGVEQSFFEQNDLFESEYLLSTELGIKGLIPEQNIAYRLAAFYMHRDDMQLKSYKEYPAGDDKEPTFVGYIGNAASGVNYGVELEVSYQVTDNLSWQTALGWLDTKIEDYVNADGQSQNGRDQAQAPRYTYSTQVRYSVNNALSLSVSVEGKDEYFFSDSHDEKAEHVNLVNANVNYQINDVEFTLWIRNAFERDYATRGFRFGNDPRDYYAPHTYLQFAEPRMFGLNMNYSF